MHIRKYTWYVPGIGQTVPNFICRENFPSILVKLTLKRPTMVSWSGMESVSSMRQLWKKASSKPRLFTGNTKVGTRDLF